MSLKGRAEMVNAYIMSAIIYRLTIVSCPSYCLIRLEHILFIFMWKGCCSSGQVVGLLSTPSLDGLGMPWLLMHRHRLRLHHLQCFLEGKPEWAQFMRPVFLQLVSLMELQCSIKGRPRLGAWHLEHYWVLTVLFQPGNRIGGCSSLVMYSGLVIGDVTT